MAYKKSSDELRKKPNKKRNSYYKKESSNLYIQSNSKDLYSHSKDKSFDLSSMGNRAKTQKSKKLLILSNVLISLLLVVSIVSFTATAFLESSFLKNSSIDAKETNDKYESIKTSVNENVSYFLICGVDLSENLTDIIMVACYDLANNEMNILQIPRDTYVGDVPSGKINAVYGHPRTGESKIKALIRCINKNFGLPIDHYATITVKGTEKVIDAMGGIDITLDRDYVGKYHLVDDSRKPEQYKELRKGKVHLDGQWATALIRNRKNTYVNGVRDGGDFGRLQNQRAVYAEILKKLTNVSFGEVTSIVTNCMNDVSTDLPIGLALGYAEKANNLKLDKVNIMSLPGQSQYINKLSCWACHKQETVDMINKYFRPYETTKLSTSDISILDYSQVTSKYSKDYGTVIDGGSLSNYDREAATSKKSQ